MPLMEIIVSGGHRGADRAALDFAIENGILHGDWCSKGRLADDGPPTKLLVAPDWFTI